MRLRLVGERRSVTDSLLSWAGQRDRLAGRDFGMVLRTGGRGQVEIPVAAADTTSLRISRYPGQSQQNFIAGLRGNLDYALTPRINIGAGFQYDFCANWDETGLFLRLQSRF